MQKNKLNNVIVLKELSSNIVEEAIVVLKPYVNLKQSKNNESSNEQSESKRKTILKEAEFVIENYISQVESKNNQIEKSKIEKKYKYLKALTIALSILNFILFFKLF